MDWAYAPGEVKILTSSDGANFDEVQFWQSSARAEVAFEETLMFPTPQSVKAVTIAMRSPQSWGYFGINSVALLAEPGPFMLVRYAHESLVQVVLTVLCKLCFITKWHHICGRRAVPGCQRVWDPS